MVLNSSIWLLILLTSIVVIRHETCTKVRFSTSKSTISIISYGFKARQCWY
ncbi:hypothetical protein ABFS83_12G051300 [Erythranthe nasuta]